MNNYCIGENNTLKIKIEEENEKVTTHIQDKFNTQILVHHTNLENSNLYSDKINDLYLAKTDNQHKYEIHLIKNHQDNILANPKYARELKNNNESIEFIINEDASITANLPFLNESNNIFYFSHGLDTNINQPYVITSCPQQLLISPNKEINGSAHFTNPGKRLFDLFNQTEISNLSKLLFSIGYKNNKTIKIKNNFSNIWGTCGIVATDFSTSGSGKGGSNYYFQNCEFGLLAGYKTGIESDLQKYNYIKNENKPLITESRDITIPNYFSGRKVSGVGPLQLNMAENTKINNFIIPEGINKMSNTFYSTEYIPLIDNLIIKNTNMYITYLGIPRIQNIIIDNENSDKLYSCIFQQECSFIKNENLKTVQFKYSTPNKKIRILQEKCFSQSAIEDFPFNEIEYCANGAFEGCLNLKNINIQLKEEKSEDFYLGESLFKNCLNLKNVNLCNVEFLSKEMFYGCENLNRLQDCPPYNLKTIKEYSLYNTWPQFINRTTMPNLTNIEDFAFASNEKRSDKSIQILELPEKVKNFPLNAIQNLYIEQFIGLNIETIKPNIMSYYFGANTRRIILPNFIKYDTKPGAIVDSYPSAKSQQTIEITAPNATAFWMDISNNKFDRTTSGQYIIPNGVNFERIDLPNIRNSRYFNFSGVFLDLEYLNIPRYWISEDTYIISPNLTFCHIGGVKKLLSIKAENLKEITIEGIYDGSVGFPSCLNLEKIIINNEKPDLSLEESTTSSLSLNSYLPSLKTVYINTNLRLYVNTICGITIENNKKVLLAKHQLGENIIKIYFDHISYLGATYLDSSLDDFTCDDIDEIWIYHKLNDRKEDILEIPPEYELGTGTSRYTGLGNYNRLWNRPISTNRKVECSDMNLIVNIEENPTQYHNGMGANSKRIEDSSIEFININYYNEDSYDTIFLMGTNKITKNLLEKNKNYVRLYNGGTLFVETDNLDNLRFDHGYTGDNRISIEDYQDQTYFSEQVTKKLGSLSTNNIVPSPGSAGGYFNPGKNYDLWGKKIYFTGTYLHSYYGPFDIVLRYGVNHYSLTNVNKIRTYFISKVWPCSYKVPENATDEEEWHTVINHLYLPNDTEAKKEYNYGYETYLSYYGQSYSKIHKKIDGVWRTIDNLDDPFVRRIEELED